ncbi:T9SS type A sorting domain-containing protein [Paraflavitalea sp. CAU 1676]|uniref:T9SS type A sorting domain-containing protein n=1 Tax=Paraflavitalea sp. CAU 1676 TaxID=3032598 RepID=UPI0023DAADB6|nr:T9SS type A sorting domain-containing protein [Paraflavitalea sp. CAU 1676]MDF2187162.1 T9SS type A sorting domain-containing protein [Paraflavitalea sp. CAU 1676]
MRSLFLCVTAWVCSCVPLFAQVSFTADNVVPPYNGDFLYGTNGGWYWTWDGTSITDISVGNRSKNIVGIESRTFRPPIPADFVDYYGYDVSLAGFQYAQNLGVRDVTVILNGSVPGQRDNTFYGPDGKPAAGNTCNQSSWMFKNMYTPIWDGGLNGTPYNDTNYCAKYVYEIVSRYKSFTKFWEVVNEPDFDQTQVAWRSRGQPGNWWENLPDPCALTNLRSPVFHYIRWLRITYDIVKTLDPTAYVCPGGIGYLAFADILCRYTDNPVDGSVTPEYPKPASAYFDVLSYHSYPQYALGYWSNAANGFVYERQSDKAAEKFVEGKYLFDSLLALYGYDGVQKPKKLFICTETNIASASFDGYIGSDVAQTNYVIKTMVLSQKHDIKQTYFFVLGDGKKASEATYSFDVMGLYECLTDNGPASGGPGYQQKIKNSGKAFKTIANLLYKAKYDAARTAALNLPPSIEGGAFLDSTGLYRYVLWAKTTGDWSENSSATYAFPAALGVSPTMELRAFDWSYSRATSIVNSNSIPLTGTPVFMSEDFTVLAVDDDKPKPPPTSSEFALSIYPNPATPATTMTFTIKGNAKVNVSIFNAEGRLVKTVLNSRSYTAGTHIVKLPIQELTSGVYYARFETEKSKEMRKFVVTK